MDIQEIISELEGSAFRAPYKFLSLLNKKDVFTSNSEILGAAYFLREYHSYKKAPSDISFRAKLLLATSEGVLFVEEGIEQICEDDCGYHLKFIPYHKITYLETDLCMLLGMLRIISGAGGESEIGFRFNTAQYQKDVETFVDVVRNQLKE